MDHVIVELILDPEAGGFTARVPDIPAYGEDETEEEAIADLKEALRAYIAAFGLQDALARINSPTTLRKLDIDLEGQGFGVVRVGRSHHVLERGHLRTTVPVHGTANLKIGTLRGILRDIEMSPQIFMELREKGR